MTTTIRTRGWLAAGLLMLAGCRSEQTAFHFRPAPVFATVTEVPAPPTPVIPALPPPAPVPALPSTTTTAAPVAVAAPVRQLPYGVVARRALRTRSEASAAPRRATRQPARRPLRAQVEHTKAFILGLLLVAGGVVLGIVLGGWLGLGVGALIVLLGYYFLGVGIGGKHAWLEVFQEFFNM